MSNGDIFYRKKYGGLWMYENGCFTRINDWLVESVDRRDEFIFIGHIAWYILEGEIALDEQQAD